VLWPHLMCMVTLGGGTLVPILQMGAQMGDWISKATQWAGMLVFVLLAPVAVVPVNET
jgi:hypothetical protein